MNSEEINSQFNLINAYNEYIKANLDERKHIMTRYIGIVKDVIDKIPKNFENLQKRLFPRIKSACFREEMRLDLQIKGTDDWDLPFKAFTDGLIITLVIDHQHSFNTVSVGQLKEWNVSFEDAFFIAKQNILDITPETFYEIGPGAYLGDWKDSHDATRIIFPQVLNGLDIRGDPVVLIPTRDHFIVTGSEDDEGLNKIASLGLKIFEEEHRTLTGIAFYLKQYKWKPFLPPKEHPSYSAFKSLRSQSLQFDYNNQKELLEKVHDQEQIDIFIATFYIIKEKETDLLESYSTWSKGVITLLPKTDLIAFYREGEKETLLCHWEDVESLVGHLMIKQTEYYPIRYLVESFPDEITLKTLRELDIRNE